MKNHVSEADKEEIPFIELEKMEFVYNTPKKPDLILEVFNDEYSRDMVIAFFEDICGSQEISELILTNAAQFNVSPALAFSLCWEESRFNVRAVNSQNRNGTIDRGLFQLNSASFPGIAVEDFFNPAINVKNGISHLRWCLDYAGTEVAALAMYNAGTGRVDSGGTPRVTLDYVSRIIDRQRNIDEHFLNEYSKVPETEEEPVLAEAKRREFVLSLLTPLGRH